MRRIDWPTVFGWLLVLVFCMAFWFVLALGLERLLDVLG